MGQRERMVGKTSFYDTVRDEIVVNGMMIHVEHDHAAWDIRASDASTGERMEFNDPATIRAFQHALRVMRRESKKRAPVTNVPKPAPAGSSTICSVCNGRRLLEDPQTGEDYTCQACEQPLDS